METKLNKDNVWFHLLNHSRNKWLDSRYFHSRLVQDIDFNTPEGIVQLEKTQRSLAIIINQLTENLITLKDKRRIITSGKGYKIAETPEELEESINFIYRKIKEPLSKIKWLRDGYNEMVHPTSDKNTEDLFIQTEGR